MYRLKICIGIPFLVILVMICNSCVADQYNDKNYSNLSISFNSGPFAGKDIKLNILNSVEVLNYYSLKNTTRVFCTKLEGEAGRNYKPQSSVNFAWIGNPEVGEYLLSNFNNSGSLNSGDIELDYTDGEYLSANIPAQVKVSVFRYDQIDLRVEGEMNFSTNLYHETALGSKTYSTMCTLKFSLFRGVDKK
ncbi:MAG: hypothetical protein IT267_10910 [Saprospiraceae bacterium]|nr:hypothetical protein [Saprospiraceae bacterium]